MLRVFTGAGEPQVEDWALKPVIMGFVLAGLCRQDHFQFDL